MTATETNHRLLTGVGALEAALAKLADDVTALAGEVARLAAQAPAVRWSDHDD